MTFLRTLRKLVFGETWLLPLGIALTMITAAIVRHAAGGAWHDAGGFLVLAGAAIVLVAATSRSA